MLNYSHLRSSTNRKRFHVLFTFQNMTFYTFIRDLTIYRTATRRQRQKNTLCYVLVKETSCLLSIVLV